MAILTLGTKNIELKTIVYLYFLLYLLTIINHYNILNFFIDETLI